MPSLLLFAICQKAIIDKQDGLVSMIGIINGISMQVTPGESILPDSVVPLPWATVASWLRSPEDEEKTFQIKIEILSSGGEIKLSVEGEPFKMYQRTVQTTVSGFGFPVEQQGIYPIKLLLREVGVDSWEEISSFPFEVIFLTQQGVTDG